MTRKAAFRKSMRRHHCHRPSRPVAAAVCILQFFKSFCVGSVFYLEQAYGISATLHGAQRKFCFDVTMPLVIVYDAGLVL